MGLAPSDESWHYDYARIMAAVSQMVHELDIDPRAKDGEDLTDYTSALSTLLSFRPRTRVDIEAAAQEEVTARIERELARTSEEIDGHDG